MINEDKVILMTKMAAYESGKGKHDITILNYFRGDYIGFQVLKAVIAATISFILVFAVYIFYNFETFMQDIYKMDLISFARNVLLYYIITVAAYGVLSYVIYTFRYAKAKKSLKCYYHNLKKLDSLYRE